MNVVDPGAGRPLLVADLAGGLGNQLFVYAATRCIALDLGFDYRYRVNTWGMMRKSNPNRDKFGTEYHSDFEQGFHIDVSQRDQAFPTEGFGSWTWARPLGTNYNSEVYALRANTVLCGAFQSTRYFDHHAAEVKDWFRFRPHILEAAERRRAALQRQAGSRRLVALHMRHGADARYFRLALDPAYFSAARERMRAELGSDDFGVVVFSDVASRTARRLLRMDDVLFAHSDSFQDLCLMSLCDGIIMPNSTYSWWAAWLAQAPEVVVIRPSIFPLNDGTLSPTDIFPQEWLTVEASREPLSVRIVAQRLPNEYVRNAARLVQSSALRTYGDARTVGGKALRSLGLKS